MRVVKVLGILLLILTFIGATILVNKVSSYNKRQLTNNEYKLYKSEIVHDAIILTICALVGISIYITGASIENLMEKSEKK